MSSLVRLNGLRGLSWRWTDLECLRRCFQDLRPQVLCIEICLGSASRLSLTAVLTSKYVFTTRKPTHHPFSTSLCAFPLLPFSSAGPPLSLVISRKPDTYHSSSNKFHHTPLSSPHSWLVDPSLSRRRSLASPLLALALVSHHTFFPRSHCLPLARLARSLSTRRVSILQLWTMQPSPSRSLPKLHRVQLYPPRTALSQSLKPYISPSLPMFKLFPPRRSRATPYPRLANTSPINDAKTSTASISPPSSSPSSSCSSPTPCLYPPPITPVKTMQRIRMPKKAIPRSRAR